jgi:hypothetical protein
MEGSSITISNPSWTDNAWNQKSETEHAWTKTREIRRQNQNIQKLETLNQKPHHHLRRRCNTTAFQTRKPRTEHELQGKNGTESEPEKENRRRSGHVVRRTDASLSHHHRCHVYIVKSKVWIGREEQIWVYLERCQREFLERKTV